MGLFDVPAIAFEGLDSLVRALPPALRVTLWGVLGAVLSMGIYALVSPQRRIARAEEEARKARQDLNEFDGTFEDARPLIAETLRTAGRRLVLVLPPALLAAVPLIAMIAWLSNAYGHRFPPDPEAVQVQVLPATYSGHLVGGDGANDMAGPRVRVVGQQGEIAVDRPLPAPVTVLEKRKWWNALFGNPAGYLPAAAPVERLDLSLPQQEIVPFGPHWLRGWAVLYFVVLLACSLAVKRLWRIA